MLAIDTNIVVRFLVNDDPAQALRAREIMLGQDVFLSTTVVLETAWVLEKAYGYPRAQLASGLRAVAGLARVSLEEPDVVAEATDWLDRGMDFADALHLSKSKDCEGMITFDKDFVKRAKTLGARSVRLV